jgi:hypothetical protein
MKDRSAATIEFSQTCNVKDTTGSKTVSYGFTTDRAHLFDGRTDVPIDPNRGGLKTGVERIQPYQANMAPRVISRTKAVIDSVYVPDFLIKVVSVSQTGSGQVTKSVRVSLISLFVPTPLEGSYTRNHTGIITRFRGDRNFRPFYFEDQVGTLRVRWDLGSYPS